MNAWQKTRLGDLFQIKHGYAFKSAHFSDAPGATVLTPGNFEAGGGLKLRPGKDRSYNGEFPAEFRLSTDDLLVVMTDLTQEAAILGAPAYVPEGVACLHNQRLGKVVDLDARRLDRRYLYYVFNTHEYRERLRATATGATVKHTSPSRIYDHVISLPPIDTQRRIASILGAYDDLIDVNRRRVAVLEEMARGLFEEWFVRFRFPGHESVSLVDTPDGPLPKGWSTVPLADLCSRITDGAHRSPPSVEVGKQMASVRDMREWGFDYSACRTIEVAEWDELVKGDCRPLVGDILIAKDGANLNKHTFLVWREEPVVLLSSIAMIRPMPKVQREFLTATLRSSRTDAAIKNMKSGAAIPRIVLKDFKRLPIVWPKVDIRDHFEHLIHPLHQQCRLLVESNQRLAASRDLLLPRLISGQLSVEVAERELEVAA